jgi:hypothetical protein
MSSKIVWREVTNNSADNGGMIICAPVGPNNAWDNMSVRISGNTVDRQGFMLAHPNKEEDIEAMMRLQMKYLSLKRQSRRP